MFEKSFITDCEGPLTLNDNAFELAAEFIEDGGELFKFLSLYDDYLVDVVKKENYKAGNTLKLILPFFVVEGLKNKDLIEFSQNHIYSVEDSKFLLTYLQKEMNTYIVSTSYGQYIEAISNYMELPFKNTFYTKVNLDNLTLTDEEITKITEFKKLILENPEDYEVVGGLGKKLAIDQIIERDNINKDKIFYIGDSITDVEPLDFAHRNNGISVSFNGNEYPLKVAEIAIVSPSAVTTAVIANIYANNDKNKVIEFIKDYNNLNDYESLFNDYNIDEEIKDKFFSVFSNENYPLIQIINENNFDEILKVSKEMRNNIRGQDIGGLG